MADFCRRKKREKKVNKRKALRAAPTYFGQSVDSVHRPMEYDKVNYKNSIDKHSSQVQSHAESCRIETTFESIEDS